jgi:hypothetical protein
VVGGVESAIYLSGAYNPVRRLSLERPAIVIWPRAGAPVLLAAQAEEGLLAQSHRLAAGVNELCEVNVVLAARPPDLTRGLNKEY